MFDFEDKSGYYISNENNKRAGIPVFHVFADQYVPDERMIHVAGVAAQILDADGDMLPDGGKPKKWSDGGSGITLAKKLRDNFAHITIHSETRILEKAKANDNNNSNHDGREPVEKYFDTKYFEDLTGLGSKRSFNVLGYTGLIIDKNKLGNIT